MTTIGCFTAIATGMAAALIGLASPAMATLVADPLALPSVDVKADVGHHQWVNNMQQQVKTPRSPIVGNGR